MYFKKFSCNYDTWAAVEKWNYSAKDIPPWIKFSQCKKFERKNSFQGNTVGGHWGWMGEPKPTNVRQSKKVAAINCLLLKGFPLTSLTSIYQRSLCYLCPKFVYFNFFWQPRQKIFIIRVNAVNQTISWPWK